MEFIHAHKNCLVNQREIGTHTRSFKSALRAAPDQTINATAAAAGVLRAVPAPDFELVEKADEKGRVRLSMKAAAAEDSGEVAQQQQ